MCSNRDLILTGQIETGSMILKHLKTNIVVIDFNIGNIPSRNKFYSILSVIEPRLKTLDSV